MTEAPKCKKCRDEGCIVHPPSAYDIRVGESRRLHEPCPDCQREAARDDPRGLHDGLGA